MTYLSFFLSLAFDLFFFYLFSFHYFWNPSGPTSLIRCWVVSHFYKFLKCVFILNWLTSLHIKWHQVNLFLKRLILLVKCSWQRRHRKYISLACRHKTMPQRLPETKIVNFIYIEIHLMAFTHSHRTWWARSQCKKHFHTIVYV